MKFILSSLLLILTGSLFAQSVAEKRIAQFNIEKNEPAIEGYDPVAYFKSGHAVEGKKQFRYEYQGIVYQFSSAENLEQFKKTPAAFEPQYGGWCAYAMGSDGTKVDIDPETFTIIDGKLYLFYNKFFNNTLKTWNKDPQNLKKKADANWPKLYH